MHMMQLTEQQQHILNGGEGETLKKVLQTLIRYGEVFGATKMVPVTGKYNHLVTSFGLKALGPVYELMNQLIEAGAVGHILAAIDIRRDKDHLFGKAQCVNGKQSNLL